MPKTNMIEELFWVSASLSLYTVYSFHIFKLRRELLKKKVLFSRGSAAAFLPFRQALTLHTATFDLYLVGSLILMGVAGLFIVLGAGAAHQENNPLAFIVTIPAALAFIAMGLDVGPWMKRFIITEGGIIDNTLPFRWISVKSASFEKHPQADGFTVVLQFKRFSIVPFRMLSDIDFIKAADYDEILKLCQKYMPEKMPGK